MTKAKQILDHLAELQEEISALTRKLNELTIKIDQEFDHRRASSFLNSASLSRTAKQD